MGLKDKAQSIGKRFRLDSHHRIERFGVLFTIVSVFGALLFVTSGFSTYKAGRDDLARIAVYTDTFTTSKTDLNGTVDGLYVNDLGNKALMLMHFDSAAEISYDANDYQAFVLGSDKNLESHPLETAGIDGSFHVFGSTGYVGVLLEADEPFASQVINVTLRANAELTFSDQRDDGDDADELAGDKTFAKYDQWRLFVNPGATDTRELEALNSETFDPALAFYEVVMDTKEDQARSDLDTKLLEMRSDLSRIDSYTSDLETTKVDGLFLRPPDVPTAIKDDEIIGDSAAESPDGISTLTLKTRTVFPGGFDFDWRSGTVYDGYLEEMVPAGENYAQFLTRKSEESDTSSDPDDPNVSDSDVDIDSMVWILSDGTSLTEDYSTSDVTMRPLVNIMNNLSQAYQDYHQHKSEYQTTLSMALLGLDVDLRDVESNSSSNDGESFLVTYY